MEDEYHTGKYVRSKIGVADSTLRRWANEDKIKYITTIGGKRLYNIPSIIGVCKEKIINEDDKRISVCYCRVSSNKQKNDLKRQEEYMRSQFPDHKILSDIGSGINWKRPNFSKLLADSINGKIKEIVIAHKDRLCRFNFELLEYIFKVCKVELLVLGSKEYKSEESELAEDLLSIIHIFNCRQMGKRRYNVSNKSKAKRDDNNEKNKNEINK